MTCPDCDGRSRDYGGVVVVEHAPGCEYHAELVRRRYPLRRDALPDTPRPTAFGGFKHRVHNQLLRPEQRRAAPQRTTVI